MVFRVKADLVDEDACLVSVLEEGSQTIVTLLLVGRATPYLHNGVIYVGDEDHYVSILHMASVQTSFCPYAPSSRYPVISFLRSPQSKGTLTGFKALIDPPFSLRSRKQPTGKGETARSVAAIFYTDVEAA